MTGSVYAAGHWRRRDPLAGLSACMRAALAGAAAGALVLDRGLYVVEGGEPERAPPRFPAVAPMTVYALADRGLLRFAAGPTGDRRAFRITPRGQSVAAEITRRAEVRQSLTRPPRRGSGIARRETGVLPDALSPPITHHPHHPDGGETPTLLEVRPHV